MLDEVEDIVPGVTQNLTITLEAGSLYELICYLDDSPRGTLTVDAAASGTPFRRLRLNDHADPFPVPFGANARTEIDDWLFGSGSTATA